MNNTKNLRKKFKKNLNDLRLHYEDGHVLYKKLYKTLGYSGNILDTKLVVKNATF